MPQLTVTVEKLVHGGLGLAYAAPQRPIFIPGVLPGERVQVEVAAQAGRSTHARLRAVLQPSPDRVEPRCAHAGLSGDCDFQHIAYPAQLRLKTALVQDQFERLAGLRDLPLLPIAPNPAPWEYRSATALSPTADGRLGYWSRSARRVEPVDDCHRLHPGLRTLLRDIDLSLPDLRKLTLRVGSDGALLLALETEEAEPPELDADFPVSVALVLPDGTAATLIGDPFLAQETAGRVWRVSAGSFFHPSLAGAEQLAAAVWRLAEPTGRDRVFEGYSGVGLLTAGLAAGALHVTAAEKNPAAVEDAAANLDDTDNVALYNGWVEDVLPELPDAADLWVLDPDQDGLSDEVIGWLARLRPARLIVSQAELGTAARNAGAIARAGYRLTAVQPLDMEPQTHHIHTVTAWSALSA